MSAQPKPNEPSMEEILASIRRIIADDDGAPAAEAPAPEPAPVAAEPESAVVVPLTVPSVDEDILDLSSEATMIPAPEPAEIPQPAPVDDIDFADLLPKSEPQPDPEPVAQVVPPVETPAPPPPFAAAGPFDKDMAALLSDQASSAVNNAFGQLAHTVLSSNARTLEDLVKDMLKPMLKTWLDDNLPGMVERLVRAEIERVARGGRR